MSGGRLRLRLAFDDDIPSDVLDTLGRRIMYQPSCFVPHIASLGSLIQHDFGISSSGRLAISVESWRLPLCSSTAVLRDDDVLKVSLASGTEPELQVHGNMPWKAGPEKTLALNGMPMEPASKPGKAVAIANDTMPALEQQRPQKKRKRAQPDDAEAQGTSQAMLSVNAKAAPSEADIGEETGADSEDTEEQESDKPKTKGPSRNARRKKHKRQLKRLGLLGSPAGTPGGQNREQAGVPQGADAHMEEGTPKARRMRLQDHAARPNIEEPAQARETHTDLPKRGEQWQHSADVAEFLQKGHVHFLDSDSEGDMLLAKESTPEHAAEAQSEQQGLNVRQGGGIIQSTERQAEHFRKMQPVQQPQQSHQAASINYDSLPRPSPYPLEGDVIAYRLLHIGADWTPQVSEWREGRVMSLDTALQSIAVEPWQRGSTRQSGAAEGPYDDMDEDEHPPTEYDEDGVLRTSLHSLSDLRVIQDMASRTPASGRHQGRRERVKHGVEVEQQAIDRTVPSSHPPGPPKMNGASREATSLGAAASEADAVHDQPHSIRAMAASQDTVVAGLRAGPHRQPAAMHIATQAVAEDAGQQPAAMQQPAAPCTTGGLLGRPAVQSTPTSAPERPIHSSLGPPVAAAGRTARNSPAAFAEAAAALKRRRAELAQQQNAQLADSSAMQAPSAIARQQTSEVVHAPPGPQEVHLQSQQALDGPSMQRSAPAIEATAAVHKPAHPRAAQSPAGQPPGNGHYRAAPSPGGPSQMAGDGHAAPSAEPAAAVSEVERAQAEAAILGGADAQATSQTRSGDMDSAADAQKQAHGVRTRSAARKSERSGPASPAAAEPALHEVDSNGGHQEPVSRLAPEPFDHARSPEGHLQAGGPEGHTQQKRTRASTRGSLIGPLLARLRREEQEGAPDAMQSP